MANKTYCFVENGVVTNRAVFDGTIPNNWPNRAKWIASEVAQIGWTYANGKFVAPTPPVIEVPDPVTIVYKGDLWRRATDVEAEAIIAALDAQPKRRQRLFNDVLALRSDDELWPLLMGAATQLFGAARAAELLAPSEP